MKREYHKKRDKNKTPEPMYFTTTPSDTLRFVVQKHKASHLHYDLRLELDGVLISFALPKGLPSFQGEKRIAIHVEDHPLAYKDFEGEIPSGNYGAGVVSIWDRGNYSTTDWLSMDVAVKQLRQGLKKGHLALVLNGERLSGVYHLIKLAQSSNASEWLIFKNNPKSLKPDEMPAFVVPMLASSAQDPFNKKGWIFEIKWDGYRCLARIKDEQVQLFSRNHKSYSNQFAPVCKELLALKKHDVILDGEIVVLDDDGRSSFSSLQKYLRTKKGNLVFYVFDLIYCDGFDLRSLSLLERKERLEILLYPLRNTKIRLSDHIEQDGVRFFEEARKMRLEGVVAKDALSTYRSERSREWLKIRAHNSQEFVIGGFTHSASKGGFSSLLLGYYDNEKLVYAGLVGTGLRPKDALHLHASLKRFARKTSPFSSHPTLSKEVTYVSPRFVCQISFTEWTKDGLIRHPVFMGLRKDIEAKNVKAHSP